MACVFIKYSIAWMQGCRKQQLVTGNGILYPCIFSTHVISLITTAAVTNTYIRAEKASRFPSYNWTILMFLWAETVWEQVLERKHLFLAPLLECAVQLWDASMCKLWAKLAQVHTLWSESHFFFGCQTCFVWNPNPRDSLTLNDHVNQQLCLVRVDHWNWWSYCWDSCKAFTSNSLCDTLNGNDVGHWLFGHGSGKD